MKLSMFFFEASSALCIESEVEPKFSMPSARKPKRRTGEIIKGDGPISDPVLRFKVEFYFATIDKLLSALKERFEDFLKLSQCLTYYPQFTFLIKTSMRRLKLLANDLKKIYLYLQVIYESNMTCSEMF